MNNPNNKPATVLVVEDNPAMNMAICDILELNNYSVISAKNGLEALELMQNARPDVILCDIMMPHMDGYTLLRHTRASDRLRTVPFIFLTARSSPEDKREAKSIGIEDYLVKPIEPQDLVLSIDNALRRSRNLSEETHRQLDSLRTQIISTLQHEFRTPLTFILGYAEFLSEISHKNVDTETLRASINAILEGGQRLQTMIENFLLLADLQARTQLPEPIERITAYSLWKSVMEQAASIAATAGLSIVLSELNMEEIVAGNRHYLYESLHRLLKNAVDYSRPESRYIWLSVVTNETHVGLRIKDEGTGIPKQELDQLRQPFKQASRDDRTTPGAGLSLALIHHVARLHGGSLEIDSVENQGSTFTLWLPRPLD